MYAGLQGPNHKVFRGRLLLGSPSHHYSAVLRACCMLGQWDVLDLRPAVTSFVFSMPSPSVRNDLCVQLLKASQGSGLHVL